MFPGAGLRALPTQPHPELPAADEPQGSCWQDFLGKVTQKAVLTNLGLTLLPTLAEDELGQRVSHGVCKHSDSSSKEGTAWPTQLHGSLFQQLLEAKSWERLLLLHLPSQPFLLVLSSHCHRPAPSLQELCWGLPAADQG